MVDVFFYLNAETSLQQHLISIISTTQASQLRIYQHVSTIMCILRMFFYRSTTLNYIYDYDVVSQSALRERSVYANNQQK